MNLFFDESGDYAFPAERFDCYAQAALICPDGLLDTIEEFVEGCKCSWGVVELHAVALSGAQLLEIAQFIGSSELSALASVTDTELITLSEIEQHRLDQAAITKRNLDWYRRESGRAEREPAPEVEQWMDRMIKRAGLMSQVSHGEFVQAQFLVHLIREALQKAMYVYCSDKWRDDSWDFRFVLDGKLPTKKADGEKYLYDMLVPALGSQDGRALGLVETWKREPAHPFVQRYSRDFGRIRGRDVAGVIDLKALFGDGLRFESSERHAGLQLVDAVAYITRRAVLAPYDPVAQWAYDELRPRMLNEEGQAITIQRLQSGQMSERARDRYRPVYAPRR